ncbi:MAG: protein rep [Rhodocyclaceae bacterium]
MTVNKAGARAWYSGVMQCGNVWGCPICSERISRVRQDELARGLGLAIEAHYGIQMLTLTVGHGVDDDLKTLRGRFSKAMTRMKGSRRYRALLDRLGHIGEVRAFEVTHGRNGWHPHTHAIELFARPQTAAEQRRYRREVFVMWARACAKVGLPAPKYRSKDGHYVGVDVQGARHAAKYVSKWGFAQELVGAKYKAGKASGRTPWQLLSDATEGDVQAAVLWQEFVAAFKGVAQLYWSKGLRKRLGLTTQITDQQALELEPAETEEVAAIAVEDWVLVCGAKLRGRLLELAVSDPASIEDRIARLREAAATEKIDPGARGWRKRIRWDAIRGFWY